MVKVTLPFPNFVPEECKGCKKCAIEKGCPVGAAKVVDGVLSIDENTCIHCGRCAGKCYFKALADGKNGFKVTIGGRWGKQTAKARALDKIFMDENEVMDIIEKIILFYRNEGVTGERFADTINRLGFDYVQDTLLN